MELKLGNSANVQQGGERGSTDAAAESANAISRGGKNTDAAAGAANVPIPADAERIVPVEGRVQLPAGTRLDSIRIVGTDLVVTLPDGEVVVIADGALRMPQLVIGTITIPQANIAALIAGSTSSRRPAKRFAGRWRRCSTSTRRSFPMRPTMNLKS